MAKETIKRKIAALRAKTEAAGCTEAEAIAAAALAAKLMQEHGLSEADIELVMARARVAVSMPRWQRWLAFAICKATNTHVISCLDGTRELEFSGKEHAVEIALYLRDILTRAVNSELRKLRDTIPYRRLRKATSKSDMTTSFALGMVHRLSAKLQELFAGTISEAERSAAEAALQAKYTDLTVCRHREFSAGNGQAYLAGARAGNSVQLSHGVAGKSDTLTIDLDDRGNVIPEPKKGTKLTVKIGYAETGLVEIGTFEVHGSEFKGAAGEGEQVTIQAKGTSLSSSRKLKETGSESFKEGSTLKDVASKVAERSGLTLRIDAALGGVKYPDGAFRHMQSDLDFLGRLVDQANGLLKISGDIIAIAERGSGKNAAGKTLPVIQIRKRDAKEWTYTRVVSE